ncbi:MAG: hypothetical protein WAL63_04230, partial [Solirubrobacteraceae bacterium]
MERRPRPPPAQSPRRARAAARRGRSPRPARARPPPPILDLRLIRRDPEAVTAALSRRGPDAAAAVSRVVELDEQWRALTAELEQLRAEQNQASRALRGAPTPEQREA